MPYCPNCAASLPQEDTATCWNCMADLGPDSYVQPVGKPLGPFHPTPGRSAPSGSREQPYTDLHPLVEVVLRFFFALLIWLVLAALAVVSVMPYGGQSVFVTIALLGACVLGAWVLWPLTRL